LGDRVLIGRRFEAGLGFRVFVLLPETPSQARPGKAEAGGVERHESQPHGTGAIHGKAETRVVQPQA